MDRDPADAARALTHAEAELGLLGSRLASQNDALESREKELAASAEAVTEAEAALEELADVSEARRAVELQRGEVDLARTAMLSARSR